MVSVVVPIYNIEKCLWQCVESIVSQTYADLQIILVDDGSTDSSGNICDEYAAKDGRIVVIHKANGGLSDARNAGVAVANGEYVFFVDGDDWLHSNAISEAVDYSQNNDCNVVQISHWYAFTDSLGYEKRYVRMTQKPFYLSREEAMRQLLLNDYLKNFAWGKLYRTEMVKNQPFPVGKFFEDSYWQHLIVDKASKVGIIPQPYYFYRQRTESISGGVSLRSFDLIEGLENRLSFISEKYPSLYKVAARRLWKAVWLLRFGINNSDPAIRKAYISLEYNLINRHKKRHDKLLWNDYRYVALRKAKCLIPFLSFCERVYDFIFVPYLEVGCAEYDSVDEMTRTLDMYGIEYRIRNYTESTSVDFLTSTEPTLVIDCANVDDVVEALRLSGYNTNKRKWNRHDCHTVINGISVRVILHDYKSNERAIV